MSNNYYRENLEKTDFLTSKASKSAIILVLVLSTAYMLGIAFLFPIGNKVFFAILIATQIYYLWLAISFGYIIWDTSYMPPKDPTFKPPVDVFITVAGEPVEVVEETAIAAQNMDYPEFNVYLLNDGYVAKKDNWREIELLAKRLGIGCITRKTPGGAKAGNINNALKHTDSPFIAIFDADHVPHEDFLKKMVAYAFDPKVAFVQSPQFYRNYHSSDVSAGAWEKQELFFGPICKGKNRMNSTFMCGTNMVVRRTALIEAGGMCETNIAEDFLTSVFIHNNGWKSVYVPEVLAEGLAPEDFLSYYKQQYRWARGSLEMIFKYNPLFMKGLSRQQKFQYIASASYYLGGVVIFLNALFPLLYFFFGITPFTVSTMVLAGMFLPYIVAVIYLLSASTNFSYTYRAMAFSMSLFALHMRAMWGALTNKKETFVVTSKKAIQGDFLNLVVPHITYIVLVIIGAGYAIIRDGLVPAVITNISWAMLYSLVFIVFITASAPNLFKVATPEKQQA